MIQRGFKSKRKAFFFGQRGCMKSHKKHEAEGKIIKPFKPSFRPFWSINGLTFSLHIEINKKEMLSSVRAMNATYFPNHTSKVSQGQTSIGLGGGGTKKTHIVHISEQIHAGFSQCLICRLCSGASVATCW